MFRLQLVESLVIVCRANQFTGFYMMTTLAFKSYYQLFLFLENFAQKQENEKAMVFFVVFRKTFGNE